MDEITGSGSTCLVRHYTLSDTDLTALPPSSDTAAEAPETMARSLAQLPAPPEQPRTVDRMLGIDPAADAANGTPGLSA